MTPKMIVILAGVATLTFMSINAAYAQDREFRYATAELSTLSGAERIYSRIQDTANKLCGEEYGGFRLVTHAPERKRCIDEIVRELVTEINHPQLDRVHAASGRRS